MNTEIFKKKLEEELKTLEGELPTVGRKNPDDPKDWEAKPADVMPDTADDTELADSFEEFETNTGILKQLEIRYNEVKEALQKIASEKYGVCEIGGEPIEEPRLMANPAAKTCIKHK